MLVVGSDIYEWTAWTIIPGVNMLFLNLNFRQYMKINHISLVVDSWVFEPFFFKGIPIFKKGVWVLAHLYIFHTYRIALLLPRSRSTIRFQNSEACKMVCSNSTVVLMLPLQGCVRKRSAGQPRRFVVMSKNSS